MKKLTITAIALATALVASPVNQVSLGHQPGLHTTSSVDSIGRAKQWPPCDTSSVISALRIDCKPISARVGAQKFEHAQRGYASVLTRLEASHESKCFRTSIISEQDTTKLPRLRAYRTQAQYRHHNHHAQKSLCLHATQFRKAAKAARYQPSRRRRRPRHQSKAYRRPDRSFDEELKLTWTKGHGFEAFRFTSSRTLEFLSVLCDALLLLTPSLVAAAAVGLGPPVASSAWTWLKVWRACVYSSRAI